VTKTAKMADLPGVVSFIAEQRRVSERTVWRWLAKERPAGFYRSQGGHWRVRKLPPDAVEAMLRWQCAELLEQLKSRLRLNEVMEYTYITAGIANDDLRAIRHPDPIQRQRNIEAMKSQFPEKWGLLRPGCLLATTPEKLNAVREHLKEPRPLLGLKAQILRLHGYEVTPKTLADMLCISVRTLNRRFGRDVVQAVCREVNIL
jgi:AraC-like DNA-binding protein